MKFIYKFIAFSLFMWMFYRNTFDVRTVLIFIGAIGWLIMGEKK